MQLFLPLSINFLLRISVLTLSDSLSLSYFLPGPSQDHWISIRLVYNESAPDDFVKKKNDYFSHDPLKHGERFYFK